MKDFITDESELRKFGLGEVAFIRKRTFEEAKNMFPRVEGIPPGTDLFSVHKADGTPIALTDTRGAALGHVNEEDLEEVTVH